MISPTLAIRAGGLFQDASVAGRNYIKDDRDGGFVAAKWTPLDTVKLYGELHPHQSARPARFRRAVLSAGLAHRRAISITTTAGGPFPDFGVNRNNFYGLVNRDYYSIKQDIGTVGGEVYDHAGPDAEQQDQCSARCWTTSERCRKRRSDPNPRMDPQPNPQSRYQVTETSPTRPRRSTSSRLAAGRIRAGRRRILARDREHRQICGPQFGSAAGRNARRQHRRRQHLQSAIHLCDVGGNPQWTGLPTKIAIDTTSGYLIDTANYNDFVILNGGVRYDDYNIKASGFGTAEQQAQRVQCAGASIMACRTSTSA